VNNRVDSNESVLFTFASPATDITYFVNGGGNTNANVLIAERILEIFGAGGGSLGTFNQNGSWLDRSIKFGVKCSDRVI